MVVNTWSLIFLDSDPYWGACLLEGLPEALRQNLWNKCMNQHLPPLPAFLLSTHMYS